jgi:fumarate reductase flavoprotein subunit
MKDGRICGIRADGAEIACSAVILACGGLGNADRALRETYFPDGVSHADIAYRGGEGNRGDAITLGLEVGAVVAPCSINKGVLSLTPQFDLREAEGFLPRWLVFVNREGRRFMAEDAPYAVAGDILNAQTDRVCFAIFDQHSFDTADGKGCKDGDMPGAPCPNWEHSVFVRALAAGRIVKADTLEELGRRIGVHAGALCENIRRYNAGVERGKDDEYFKNLNGTTAVIKPPFYATPVRALVNTVTGAGLRIDADAQVHNESDAVIPGLYAAGEAAGGLVGHCIGGGGSLGPPVIFGRVAGSCAARYAKTAAQRSGMG